MKKKIFKMCIRCGRTEKEVRSEIYTPCYVYNTLMGKHVYAYFKLDSKNKYQEVYKYQLKNYESIR